MLLLSMYITGKMIGYFHNESFLKKKISTYVYKKAILLIILGYCMYIIQYSEQVHVVRMHELASVSPPYERVPNIF